MAITSPDPDRKATDWVRAVSPDDDYMPPADAGRHKKERLAEHPEALVERTATPQARRAIAGRFKVAPVKTKAVRKRGGGITKVSVPLTLEEYNAQVTRVSSPVGQPLQGPPPIDPTPEVDPARPPLPRRGKWSGPPIEWNAQDPDRADWDPSYYLPFEDVDVIEIDRNYADEFDLDLDDSWNHAWDRLPGVQMAALIKQLEDDMNWWFRALSPARNRAAERERQRGIQAEAGYEASMQPISDREQRFLAGGTPHWVSLMAPRAMPEIGVDDAKLIADQWRSEAAAKKGTCGNPNGCDGSIKAKDRCTACHEWRRTHHGAERPAARINRARRLKL